eukprot:2189846-Prymnesium_polylepis.2
MACELELLFVKQSEERQPIDDALWHYRNTGISGCSELVSDCRGEAPSKEASARERQLRALAAAPPPGKVVFILHGALGGRFYGTDRAAAMHERMKRGNFRPVMKFDSANNWTRHGTISPYGRNYLCNDCMFARFNPDRG